MEVTIPSDFKASSSSTEYFRWSNPGSAPSICLAWLFIVTHQPSLSKTASPQGIWFKSLSRNFFDDSSFWKRAQWPEATAMDEAADSRNGISSAQ